MSDKKRGADSILYDASKGTLVTTGALAVNSWYKIKARAATNSALPDLKIGTIFKTPQFSADVITLAAGDEVYPMTLTEVCKVDVEISGEAAVVETTDSCDYPYISNIPDGFTNLSGSLNTMLRFDEETSELIDVTKDYLNKFYDIIEDDAEGVYTFMGKNDSDIYLMMLLNRHDNDTKDIVENWLIIPAVLTGVTQNVALKDVQKADFSWSKGQDPACVYTRTVLVSS